MPWWVAIRRRVPNTGSIIVIDIFLGWTLVGWVVAMAMACRSIPRNLPGLDGGLPGHEDSTGFCIPDK